MLLARRDLLWGGVALLTLWPRRCGALAASDAYPAVVEQGASTVTIADDLGARLTLKHPLARVAVFNRYTAELIRAVGGSDVIAGLDTIAEREPAYWPKLHAVGIGQGQSQPNYEAIIALRPDAVLFPRNGDWDKTRRTLAPFGIPVVVLTAWDALKHEANVALLGTLFARRERAGQLVAFHRHILDVLRARTKDVARKRVYLEEVGDYKTVLKGSGWHDMIELAGGINIFGDTEVFGRNGARGSVQAFDVDPEEILVRRPDLVMKLQPNQYRPHDPSLPAAILKALAARPGFGRLPAMANHQVYSVSYHLAGGCSKVVGALHLAKWLYPDRFADIDPSDAMRTWLEDFQGVPFPGGYWTALSQIRG